MRKITLTALPVALLAVGQMHSPAQAQTPPNPGRVFVAAEGSDSNSCTFAAPCRSFNRAASVLAPGGEIDVIDAAGYGSISVTKALSIQGHGFAGISPAASSASGVFVAAGSGDRVYLNGLIIEGEHFGSTGITVQSARQVTIENCVIRNWNDSGVGVIPSSTDVVVTVGNTVVADNGGHGIFVQPNNVGASAFFNRVEAYGNGLQGIGIFGNLIPGGNEIKASITNSVAAGNTNGFYALGASGSRNTILTISFSTTYNNSNKGIFSDDNSSIRVGYSDVASDFWGLSGLGELVTYGNNMTDGVTANGKEALQ